MKEEQIESALFKMKEFIKNRLFPITRALGIQYEDEKDVNPFYTKIEDASPIANDTKWIWVVRVDDDCTIALGIKNDSHFPYSEDLIKQISPPKKFNPKDRYGHTSLTQGSASNCAYYAGWVAQRSEHLEVFLWGGRYQAKDLTIFTQRVIEAYIAKKFMDVFGRQTVIFYNWCVNDYGETNNFLYNIPFPKTKPKRIYSPELIDELISTWSTEEITEDNFHLIFNKWIQSSANQKLAPQKVSNEEIDPHKESKALDPHYERLPTVLEKILISPRKTEMFFSLMFVICEAILSIHGSSHCLSGKLAMNEIFVKMKTSSDFNSDDQLEIKVIFTGTLIAIHKPALVFVGVHHPAQDLPPEIYVDHPEAVIPAEPYQDCYAFAALMKKIWPAFFGIELIKDFDALGMKYRILEMASDELLYEKRPLKMAELLTEIGNAKDRAAAKGDVTVTSTISDKSKIAFFKLENFTNYKELILNDIIKSAGYLF